MLDEESAREGFFKKLDASKVVQFDAGGMILAESMAMLRQMIAVHSMTVFKDRKEELMLERLDCLRSEDWPNYQAKIGQAAKEYTQIMQVETAAALRFLGV